MPKKRRDEDVLAGRTPELQLLRGVRRWVESNGGNVVVIGGIEIQEWPGDQKFTYRVAVRVTGRKPTKSNAGAVTSPHEQERTP